jgi:hypothetical protein
VVVPIGPPEMSKDRLRRTNGEAELGEARPDKSGHPDWPEDLPLHRAEHCGAPRRERA